MGHIIPVFGMKPSLGEIERHMNHFKVEMLCCTRGPHGQKGTSLNILHKSTDIDCVEGEISRVIRFLNSKEFRVTRKIWPGNIMNADLLFIGTDKNTIDDAIWLIKWAHAAIGLVPKWNMLLYGNICREDTGLTPLERPLLSGYVFHQDANRLIDNYFERQTDISALMGLFIRLATGIEDKLRKHGKADNSFNANVQALWKRIGNSQDCNVNLAMAALDWVRLLRNSVVHPMRRNVSHPERKAQQKFFTAVTNCERNDLDFYVPQNDADMMQLIRFQVRLFVLTDMWLDGLNFDDLKNQ